jgi:hypothetical protein
MKKLLVDGEVYEFDRAFRFGAFEFEESLFGFLIL